MLATPSIGERRGLGGDDGRLAAARGKADEAETGNHQHPAGRLGNATNRQARRRDGQASDLEGLRPAGIRQREVEVVEAGDKEVRVGAERRQGAEPGDRATDGVAVERDRAEVVEQRLARQRRIGGIEADEAERRLEGGDVTVVAAAVASQVDDPRQRAILQVGGVVLGQRVAAHRGRGVGRNDDIVGIDLTVTSGEGSTTDAETGVVYARNDDGVGRTGDRKESGGERKSETRQILHWVYPSIKPPAAVYAIIVPEHHFASPRSWD